MFCGIWYYLHMLAAASMTVLCCSNLQRPKKKQIKLESVIVRAPKNTLCHFSYRPLEPAHCILCDIGGPWQKGLFLWSLGFFFSGLGLGGSSLWASFLYSCRSFCASSWGSSTYCNSSSGSLCCSGILQLTGGWKNRQRNNLRGTEIQTPTKISSNVAFISNQALQQNPTALCCSCKAGKFEFNSHNWTFLCCQGVSFFRHWLQQQLA